MGSPTVFAGRRTLFLTPDGALLRSGAILDNDGDINVIANGHFEAQVLPWAAYQNTAQATPVTGAGGSPTVTITRSSSSPLAGLYSGVLTKDAANRQGEGVSYTADIPASWRGQQIRAVIDFLMSVGYDASAELLKVFVYDVTNATLLTAVTSTNVAAGQSQHVASFTVASNTAQVRLILHIAGTGTTAWTAKFDTVRLLQTNVQNLPIGNVLDTQFQVVDATDQTKAVGFDVQGTTGTKTTLQTTQTANRTLQFPDITDTVVTRTNTETLTNKTLTTPVLTSPTINLEYLTEQGSDPSTPSAGTQIIYGKTDKKTYRKDSDGTVTELGSGAATATPTVAGLVTSYAPLIQSAIHTISDASYTFLDNDGYETLVIGGTLTASRTITLPAAANNVGRRLRIVRTAANSSSYNVTLVRAASDVIYGGASLTNTSIAVSNQNTCLEIECVSTSAWSLREPSGMIIASGSLDGGFTGGQMFAYRLGNMVFISIDGTLSWASGAFTYTTSTAFIPSTFRPSYRTVFCGAPSNGSHAYNLTWCVNTNGTIAVEVSNNLSTGPDNYEAFCGAYLLRF